MIRRISRNALLFALVLAAGSLGPAHAAPPMQTPARQALLIDARTGTVLLEKNADTPMAPASMSKLMTIYMLFERMAEGRLSLSDTFPVSEAAWRKGGSKMFVPVNSRVTVEDLIRGIVIQSGNDACIVVAEGLSGTEQAFAEQMTKRGRELGLQNSVFKNSTGWPEPGHYMTARDLAILAQRIIEDFPQWYHYFVEPEFTFHGIKQGNRNPLIYKNMGVDGLKTGHTEESGYGLTASAVRNGRRLILVVNGLGGPNERSRESERLLEWGYREFDAYTIAKPGAIVDQAPVWLGAAKTVPATVAKEFAVTLDRQARREMKVAVRYDTPVPAPVQKGDRIGTIAVSVQGTTFEHPLVAAEAVERRGIFGRIGGVIGHFVWGAV